MKNELIVKARHRVAGTLTAEVESVEAARRWWLLLLDGDFCLEYETGASSWNSFAVVYDGKKKVAELSYNGRVN